MAGLHDVARAAGVKAQVVEDVFEQIFKFVQNDESVRINGFGSFRRSLFRGRKISAPVIPGGEATFPDSYVLRFKQSAHAKKRLNLAKDTGPKKKRGAEPAAEEAKAAKGKAAKGKKAAAVEPPPKKKAAGKKAKKRVEEEE